MTQELHTDIVIFGGGIAGLWLLNRLRQQGLETVLLETDALGGGQTLASQGIIHGGLKYALSGVLSPASSAIAAMPDRWRQCLAGEGDIDLRQTKVLAPHYFMWSSGGYRSRLKTFLGSKALRGRIDALSASSYPEFLRGQSLSGTLYKLTDFVVDTPSLVSNLSSPHADRIFHVPKEQMRLVCNNKGAIAQLALNTSRGTIALSAKRYILAAGEGNGALLSQIGIEQPSMQVRPLHMLALRSDHPHPVFLHCIGDSFGMTPRMTITSHPSQDGGWIWYIGGEIAESGVDRSAEQQIALGRQQLQEVFPWVDYDRAQWTSFFINRAEPKLANLQRPDTAYLHATENVLLTWPTKLTLTPELGQSVVNTLQQQSIAAESGSNEGSTLAQLRKQFATASIAQPRWEDLLR